jgi:hypothetical protein
VSLALQFRSDPDFDARWAAWLARGVEHDRKIRRRLTFVVPIAVALVVAFAYVWFTR